MKNIFQSRNLALVLFFVCGAGLTYEVFRWIRANKIHQESIQHIQRFPEPKPQIIRKIHKDLTQEDYVTLCRFLVEKDMTFNEQGRANAVILMEHIGDLTADQIRTMADEFHKFGNFETKQQQRQIVRFAIESLALRDPQAAILLLKHPSKALSENNIILDLLPSVISVWHKQDPVAAGEWIRGQIKSGDGFVDWDSLSRLPASIARLDPALAFSLMEDLRDGGLEVDVKGITSNASDDAVRSAALNCIRRLKTQKQMASSKIINDAWGGFAENLVTIGPAASSQWLGSANLSDDEKTALSHCIIRMNEPRDQAHWISWMASNLPEQTMSNQIHTMTASWASANHLEAGKFIHTMPDSEAKQVAIRAFAETVAAVDIVSAEQWAQTLLPGPHRDETMRQIQSFRAPEKKE